MAVAAERLELAQTDHRPYQVAIAEACHGRNSLVVLPTGLGKTIVAAHVMLRHLEDGERVLVVAPTRPLVDQHASTFRQRIPEVDVIALTGTMPADKRAEHWRSARVVVATPQVARNDLVAGLLEPDAWGLLVVDEAHRAVGQYAAVDVAEAMRQHECRILGTTASPGSTPDRIAEVCRTLGIEHVEARGAWDEDVRDYMAPISVEYARLALPENLERAARRIRAAVHEQVAPLRQIGLYTSRFVGRRDLLRVRDRLRRGGHGRGARASWANSHVSRGLRLLHAAELIQTQSVEAARKYLRRMGKEDRKLAARPAVAEAVRLLEAIRGEHPKMRRVATELTRELGESDDARALVFVQYRDTATALVDALRHVDGLRPGLFVGQGGDDGLTQREQAARLEELRTGTTNVLVATSVGEEGLDLPGVDLVIFYEPVPSAIRAIQRRGRTGRAGAGRVLVLIARGTADEAAYEAGRRREQRMQMLVRQLNRIGETEAPSAIRPNPVPDPGPETTWRALVDHREFSSPLVRSLQQRGVRVEPTNLPVGDLVLSDRVVIERKSAADLVRSIIDGRLMEQARALSRSFEAPILLVEGDPFAELGGVRPEAVAGAIAALGASFQLPVITVRDGSQAAMVVAALIRREQQEGQGPPRLRAGSAGRGLDEQQRYLVEGLPHVSGTLGERLLAHFGSPANVFAAEEDELRRVRGVGPATARAIRDVVHTVTETPWASDTSTSEPAPASTTPSGTGPERSGSSRSPETTS